MKKTLALILALMMALTVVLTSCGGGNDNTAETEEKKTETTTAEAKDDVTTAEQKSEETTAKVDIGTETDAPSTKTTWIYGDIDFYDKNGELLEDGPADGLDWCIFPYWKGYEDSDIYDSHGEGHYASCTFTGSKCIVWFGNGGPNNHTNILIYIDDELVDTLNGTEEFDGEPWCTQEYKVETGEHTIKVVAGTPLTPETWNGLVLNVILYAE